MTSESHSWLCQGCPSAVNDHESTRGTARASRIRRPAARWNHRSLLIMVVKPPRTRGAIPAARYQLQAVGRLVGGIEERAAKRSSSATEALRLRLSARLCLAIHQFYIFFGDNQR